MLVSLYQTYIWIASGGKTAVEAGQRKIQPRIITDEHWRIKHVVNLQ